MSGRAGLLLGSRQRNSDQRWTVRGAHGRVARSAERITSGCPSGQTIALVVWSSVPITQAGPNVNEGEVSLRALASQAG